MKKFDDEQLLELLSYTNDKKDLLFMQLSC